MICPNCLKNAELAYAAMTESLVCLTPGCGWEYPLTEDETFELFFGGRKPEFVSTCVESAGMLVH